MKKNMKNAILKWAATLSVLTFVFLAAHGNARAQNGWLPPGSYQKSCKNMGAQIYVYNDGTKSPYLIATCNEKGWTFGKGDPFPSTLQDFHLCDGDIWNDDGTLKCNKNANSKLMQTAKSAARSGWQKATGSQPSDAQVSDIVSQMITNGYLAKFFGGLKSSDVESFINQKATDLNSGEWRAKIIKQAFYDAWGYSAMPPATLAKWDAKIKAMAASSSNVGDILKQAANFKAPYAMVLQGEADDIGKDKISKRLVTMNAYKTALGRAATQNEMKIWESKTSLSFRHVVDAIRSAMYLPAGAAMLTDMYRRALECRGAGAPTDAQVTQMIIKYSGDKRIYAELCPN